MLLKSIQFEYYKSVLYIVRMLTITFYIKIPLRELEFSYARSSGPGGQNVNKVNSKAILRWNVLHSQNITEELRTRLLTRLAQKLTTDGEIVITSDRFRDQIRNREDCIEKLRQCLVKAVVIPKQRKKTKPSRSSKLKVKQSKRKYSEKKTMRRNPRFE